MPRGSHHHRVIPVPPNDQFNFFFSNDGCCDFQDYGYTMHPNYSMEEVS